MGRTLTQEQVITGLETIRTRIGRCLDNERADRQTCLEDVDEMLAVLTQQITGGRS